jgi:hypothetical protein
MPLSWRPAWKKLRLCWRRSWRENRSAGIATPKHGHLSRRTTVRRPTAQHSRRLRNHRRHPVRRTTPNQHRRRPTKTPPAIRLRTARSRVTPRVPEGLPSCLAQLRARPWQLSSLPMILKFLTSIEKSPTIRQNRSQDWSSLPTCFEAFNCHSLSFQCRCGTGFILH